MSIREILTQSVRILRLNFLLLTSLAGVLYTPPIVVAGLLASYLPQPSGITWIGVSSAIGLIAGVSLIMAFIDAATAIAMRRLSPAGRAGFSDCLISVARIGFPLSATALLLGLTFAPLWALQHFLIFGRPTARWFPISFAIFLLWNYLYLRFAVVWQVAALENAFGFSALRRSWRIMRSNLLRALGLGILGGLMFAIPGFIALGVTLWVPFLRPVVSFVILVIGLSFKAVVTTVFYLELRSQDAASVPMGPVPSPYA